MFPQQLGVVLQLRWNDPEAFPLIVRRPCSTKRNRDFIKGVVKGEEFTLSL